MPVLSLMICITRNEVTAPFKPIFCITEGEYETFFLCSVMGDMRQLDGYPATGLSVENETGDRGRQFSRFQKAHNIESWLADEERKVAKKTKFAEVFVCEEG